MVSARTRGAFLALAGSLGCSEQVQLTTELVLVADTDIAEVDTIEFTVTAESPETKTARASSPRTDEPSYLTLVRERGPRGPLTVVATGLVDGVATISRTHRVWFVERERRVVPLHLYASCLGVTCEGTCGASGCEPVEIPDGALMGWTGEPPRIHAPEHDAGLPNPSEPDGAAPEPDAGSPVPDAGTGEDAGPSDAGVPDAGGMLTQCITGMYDLQRDPRNCGYCGHDCPLALLSHHAIPICVAGQCDYGCEPLWGNCDGLRYTNGCEQFLVDDAHCGACFNACPSGQRCDGAGVCVPK